MNHTKAEQYKTLVSQVKALIDPACGWVTNYANVSAAIQQQFNHWWCGFYLINEHNQLELGPFQGPVACTLIDYGKGVCGKAWETATSIVVPDVHQFEGHIACSAESNSEIVIPIIQDGNVIGVLDIDSKHYNTFDETDRIYLEEVVEILADISVKI